MKASELRDKSVDELISLLNDKRNELFRLINDSKISKKVDKPHLPKLLRHQIARMETVIREKQLNNQE